MSCALCRFGTVSLSSAIWKHLTVFCNQLIDKIYAHKFIHSKDVNGYHMLSHNHIFPMNGNVPWPVTSRDLSACDSLMGTFGKQSVHSLTIQYWGAERNNSTKKSQELIWGYYTVSWEMWEMPVQRWWSDQGYHLQEKNDMLCTLRGLTYNMGNTNSLFYYQAFKVIHLPAPTCVYRGKPEGHGFEIWWGDFFQFT